MSQTSSVNTAGYAVMQLVTIGFGLLLALLLVVLSQQDLKFMLLPDTLTGLLAASGVAQAIIVGSPSLLEAFVAALIGGALLLAVRLFYRAWRGIDGIGLGDVKLVSAGSLWCGLLGIGPMLLAATASAVTLALVSARRTGHLDMKSRMPFGPHLSLGAFAAWLLTHTDTFVQSPY